MLCKKFYNLVYFTTTTLYKSQQMSCDNSVDLRLQTLHDWVKLHIIKIVFLILGNVSNFSDCWRLIVDWISCIQVINYEIVKNFFHISHNLTWYSATVDKFTRIYPICSTYEVTKQFMYICVKNWTIHLKKNNL